MPFLNLDDNFADHPKIDALDDAAFRLHVSGLLYCSKHLTDGFIPTNRVGRLTPSYADQVLEELMHGRLWLPANGGYSIHDFLDWNRPRAEVEEERERKRKQRSEAGRKGAAIRWGRREPTDDEDGNSHGAS